MLDNNTPLENSDSKAKLELSIQLFCALVTFSLILTASFFTGKLIGSNGTNSIKLALSKYSKELEIELANANTRLNMAETINKINADALEETRQTILQLEQQIYQQQKQIISYRTIVSKQKPNHDLVFRDLIIHATKDPQTFKYKLVLTRIDEPKLLLIGNLQISIEGIQNKKFKILPLTQITTFTKHKKSIPYSFRYMAMIPANNQYAELTFPIGFIPKKFKIIVYTQAGKTFTKEFKWTITPQP